MRTQLNRRFNGGLLGEVKDYVNSDTIGATMNLFGQIFGKNGNTTPVYTSPNSPQVIYQAPPVSAHSTDYSQFLPIALVGLLGMGAIMAFKKK